jgi:hypothetical protein
MELGSDTGTSFFNQENHAGGHARERKGRLNPGAKGEDTRGSKDALWQLFATIFSENSKVLFYLI